MKLTVTRLVESMVEPSRPTPSELLELTAIDRVPGLRHMVRSLHVFKRGQQPAKLIRDALSKALVPYYPFAGRFVCSDQGDHVAVACTGEGALFVEATANCSLENANYLDHPLTISQDELLPAPRPELNPLDVPLMMQVTEFKCGGFVVGVISVHTIADGLGAAQFIKAIGEVARGHPEPTIRPVWSRHLIPSPSRNIPVGPPPDLPTYKLQSASFHVPHDHIKQIKSVYLETNGQHCSTFDVSAATVWRSRTRAISVDPESTVRLCFFASARHLLTSPRPEGGFYGNCFYPVVVAASGKDVANGEVAEVARMIRDGKARLPVEFGRWARGELSAQGVDPYELSFPYSSLFVSDWTQLGFNDVDYGWGKPTRVIPFAYFDFMAVAILGAPRAPAKGAAVMTQCVEEEHLPAFQQHMKSVA